MVAILSLCNVQTQSPWPRSKNHPEDPKVPDSPSSTWDIPPESLSAPCQSNSPRWKQMHRIRPWGLEVSQLTQLLILPWEKAPWYLVTPPTSPECSNTYSKRQTVKRPWCKKDVTCWLLGMAVSDFRGSFSRWLVWGGYLSIMTYFGDETLI